MVSWTIFIVWLRELNISLLKFKYLKKCNWMCVFFIVINTNIIMDIVMVWIYLFHSPANLATKFAIVANHLIFVWVCHK